jgi:hypothetical protein
LRDQFREHIAQLLKYYLYPYTDSSAGVMDKGYDDAARSIVKNIRQGNYSTTVK